MKKKQWHIPRETPRKKSKVWTMGITLVWLQERVFCGLFWVSRVEQPFKIHGSKSCIYGEQDGRGVDRSGLHLSPQIHEEYTFRHRSGCRTSAESRQEYLTSGKEYIEPRKTWDQALSLWNGCTDSTTLVYQRTNPREYQIVRTYTMEITWIQDRHHPTTSSTLCRTPHPNNKQNKNPNLVIIRQDYHLTQPCPSEEKQTNK